jgi:hypothetical protein
MSSEEQRVRAKKFEFVFSDNHISQYLHHERCKQIELPTKLKNESINAIMVRQMCFLQG